MSRPLTASDRSALIKRASSLPAGSAERKAILAGLSKSSATDFDAEGWQGRDGVTFEKYSPERVSKELAEVKKKTKKIESLLKVFVGEQAFLNSKKKTDLLNLKAQAQILANASDMYEELKGSVYTWRYRS